MRAKRAEASESTFALAGLAGTGFVMGMVLAQEQRHPIVARAQRQSLLADHNLTHCAQVRSDADHMHLCKPRIRHVCIVHYAVGQE